MQKARRHTVAGAPTACKRTVSGSLSLPFPGCFPPFPHGTGTLSVFGSLQPCGMVPADSDRIPRAPPYSGAGIRIRTLPVRGCHPLRPRFPDMLRFARMRTTPVLQPRRVLERGGLGSSLFDRHY